MNKLNTTIILSLILMLSGCAANTDEAPSATTAATTTTVATITTATATTQATTTSAQTTAVTEQSEPAETTAVTTTVATTTAATTTEPEIVEDDKPEPEKPTENTTPDGKYDLADTDMVNPDGTYTQTEFNPDTIPAWSSNNPFDEAKQQRFQDRGVTSNPSKIPYSEITLENAHKAFPFLGWLGYTPDYTMVLPTDSPDVIASKVYDNLIGKEPTSDHDLWKYYNFTSEAEYNVYLAEQ